MHKRLYQEPTQNSIRLTTFGALGCFRGDSPLNVPARPLLLLVILATSRTKRLHRDSLADLLWTSNNARKGRHSLSQALYVLHRKIPEISIVGDANWVKLETGLRLDAWELEDALAANDTQRIIEVFSDGFMPMPPTDLPRSFYDWRDAEAGHVARRVEQHLKDAVRTHYRACFWEASLNAARALERLNALDEELRLIADSAERAISTHVNEEQSAPSQPFVGRHRELKKLRAEWERTLAGENRLCALRGEPGIGKSRLADRIARIAALEGASVFIAACYEAERHVAFAPLAGLLGQVDSIAIDRLDQATQQRLGALRLDRVSTSEATWGPASKQLLFEALSQALRSHAQKKPVMIFIDDFQWSDDSTSEWLHYFSRTSADLPTFVLVCMRADEKTINPISWVAGSREGVLIDVPPLSAADSSALISAVALGQDSKRDDAILRRCGGNPFFIVEMARHLADNTDHRSEGPDNIELPEAIRRLIFGRYQRLSRAAQSAAETIAAAKTGLDLDTMLRATGMGLPALTEALAELDLAKLLRYQPIDLCHDLTKHAIYTTMAPVIRQLRHRQIFDALPSTERPSAKAMHANLGGLQTEAHLNAVIAANDAMRVYAFSEACFYRTLAVDNAISADERRTALLQLIELLNILNRQSECRKYVQECLGLCEEAGDEKGKLLCEMSRIAFELAAHNLPVSLLWADMKRLVPAITREHDGNRLADAIRLALNFHAHVSDRDELQRIISFVERSAVDLDQPTRAELLSRIATVVAFHDGHRAEAIADEAVLIAKSLGDPRTEIRCLIARGSAKAIFGDLDGAMVDFEMSERIECDNGARDMLLQAYTNQACILFGRGHVEEARVVNAKALACSSKFDFAPVLNEAGACLDCEDYVNTISWGERILRENRTFGAGWVDIIGKTMIGTAKLAMGQTESAVEIARDIDSELAESDVIFTDRSYTTIFLAQVDQLNGRTTQGRRRIEIALDESRYNPPFGRCRLQIALAQLLVDVDIDLAYHYARTGANSAAMIRSDHLARKAADVLETIRLRS